MVSGAEAREAQDARLAKLTHRKVLNLLGPEDGAAHRIIVESLRLEQMTKGLDPETSMLRIVMEKWNRKRTKATP